MEKISKSFSMTIDDWEKFSNETLLKIGPYLVVIIPVFLEQLPKDMAYGAILVFLLQRLLSFLILFLSKHKV